ncbi:flavin reductase family protein Ecym_4415 [Eremothecium cymbalariae DBVPG|uniref:Flavin reductase like domain-containing protein n=1 Tax=Eremothecium cymbalariae (strain CBS 270.75 / DBVPG 7215 / KCTC 17166 / NRRL Y-17582) TaxID=931890 RepID=G8JTW3_ERECY|nr:hypothetical protein Ecym_4415 [Eremothecium cymbalariae DBVPG\
MSKRLFVKLQRYGCRRYSHEITQQRFKETMSRISSQAMILTTSNMKGVTLGSVTSLSINPRPMVQFNLQVPSFTSQEIHKMKKFALHLMSPTQHSVNMAKLFSKGAIKGCNDEFVPTRPFDLLVEGKDYLMYDVECRATNPIPTIICEEDAKIDWEKDEALCNDTKVDAKSLSLPILTSAERVIICESIRCFQVGDHEIWVGQVEEICSPDSGRVNEINKEQKTGGLVYFNRQFYKIGNPIV